MELLRNKWPKPGTMVKFFSYTRRRKILWCWSCGEKGKVFVINKQISNDIVEAVCKECGKENYFSVLDKYKIVDEKKEEKNYVV